MQNYKDLKVWEKAHAFTLKIYECTKLFPKEEIYSLTSQVRREYCRRLRQKFKIRTGSFLKYCSWFCQRIRIFFDFVKRFAVLE